MRFRPVGEWVSRSSALALGLVAFLSLLGMEKAILAIVLGSVAIRGAARGTLARRLGSVAIGLGGLFLGDDTRACWWSSGTAWWSSRGSSARSRSRPATCGRNAMSLRPDAAVGEFQALIAPLLERAAAYAYAIVRNRADAEDAVQDAALKAPSAFGRYDDSRPLKGWWLAIVRNCCRDLLRKRRCRPATVALDQRESPPQRDLPPGKNEELREAMDRLSAPHREILDLRYYGDCSYREIAAALEIPEGTVMSRLHAARQALAAVYRKAKA